MKKLVLITFLVMVLISTSYARISLVDSQGNIVSGNNFEKESIVEEEQNFVQDKVKDVIDVGVVKGDMQILSLDTDVDFVFNIKEGVSSISFPLDFGLNTASDFCDLNPNIINIQTFEDANTDSTHLIYSCSDGGDNFNIDLNKGYIVEVSQDISIELNGDEIQSSILSFGGDGTYLIGYPTIEEMDVDYFLDSVRFSYVEIHYLEGNVKKNPLSESNLEPGRAYFLEVSGAETIYYPTTSIWKYIYEVILERISGVEAQLSAIFSDIMNLRSDVDDLEQDIITIQDDVSDVRQTLEDDYYTSSEIDGMIDGIEQDIITIQDDVTNINQTIIHLNQTFVSTINQTIEQYFIENINQTINQTVIEYLNQTLNQTIEQTFYHILDDDYYNITEIDEIIDSILTELNRIDEDHYNITEIDEIITNINLEFNRTDEDLEEIWEYIRSNITEIDQNITLSQNISHLWDYIRENEDAWSEGGDTTVVRTGGSGGYSEAVIKNWIRQAVEPLEERLDELEDNFENLEPTSIRHLESETSVLRNQINNLTSENDGLRDDMQLLFERLEEMESKLIELTHEDEPARSPLTGLFAVNVTNMTLPNFLNFTYLRERLPSLNLEPITGFMSMEVSYVEKNRERPGCGFLDYKCWEFPEVSLGGVFPEEESECGFLGYKCLFN